MVTITPLVPEQEQQWRPLWQGYLDYYRETLSDAQTALTFRRLTDPAHPGRGALAWSDDGTAAGLVHWLTHPSTWSETEYCYLEDLFVAPGLRGAGVGRALLGHVRAWAQREGCSKVYWLTEETNTTARRLYDAVGRHSGFVHYEIDLD